MEKFYDLLFEISSDYRHRILLLLKEKPMRVTDLSKQLRLTTQEISRHVTRLNIVGLSYKDVDGFYHLSPYGLSIQILLEEFEFISKNSDYFVTHSLAHIRPEFVKRIGDLSGSSRIDSVVDFLYYVENLINEAKEYIWFNVDQYPVTALSSILEALGRGIKFRTIEQEDRIMGPHLVLQAPDEVQALSRAKSTPLIEQGTSDRVDVILYISEKGCVFAFPDIDGEFDYRGFTATDNRALKWCRDLFQHYWEIAEPRVYISPTEYVQPRRMRVPEAETRGRIIVEGKDDSSIDHQAIQDAVDNFDEVTLRGTFNIGLSSVVISRSVVVRGEGREDDVPLTKVYKSGWSFPFYGAPGRAHLQQRRHVFLVDGEGIDVTIENIHFTDFDYTCLDGHNGNSMTIRNNRITLETGLGRGVSSSTGDQVIGIMQFAGFPGGVRIEGNYLDFALYHGPSGVIARWGADDPNYRPDLSKHNCYAGFGIDIFYACGKVVIENNIVRNVNTRAIVAADNRGSAHIQIRNNTVISEVYGPYWGPRTPHFAGVGISARSPTTAGPAPRIDITGNTVRCDKVNYCGIRIAGPGFAPKGADKLTDGIVKDNRIHLENGSIGIYTESCDNFEIANNTLTGKAYYGVGIFPGVDPKRTDLGSHGNIIEDNNMKGFKIKDPDEYSKVLFDEKVYAGSKAGSTTAHIWLSNNTKGNVVKISSDETVIDEGEDNTIIR